MTGAGGGGGCVGERSQLLTHTNRVLLYQEKEKKDNQNEKEEPRKAKNGKILRSRRRDKTRQTRIYIPPSPSRCQNRRSQEARQRPEPASRAFRARGASPPCPPLPVVVSAAAAAAAAGLPPGPPAPPSPTRMVSPAPCLSLTFVYRTIDRSIALAGRQAA